VNYLERKPAPPLAPFIRALWYAEAPATEHTHERILPSGCVEVILNLAREFFVDCAEGTPDRPNAPALVVGARSVYEIVDTADMTSLIGIHFHPGGFGPFVGDCADRFSNLSLPLDQLWGSSVWGLRDALREMPTAQARLDFVERWLLERFTAPRPRHAMVEFALGRFARDAQVASIRSVAKTTGWSERRFSQVFREQVGFAPKVWCRIQRFQRALKQLHAGADLPWAELALECGFYDQSHFANEFRAFSGIDATTYSALRTRFTNHIRVK
jgi:AraC-like DNA-binding protein